MTRMPVMDERIRHRRQSVASAEARRRRRFLASLVAVAGLLVAAVLVARSPLFSVTDIRVEGVSDERADEVRDAAAVRVGDNLLDVDLTGAAERVTALPWVAEADARRTPPSAVTVRVAPRQPVAVAHTGDAAWLLDADGVVVAGGARADLPVVEVPDDQLPPLGETVTEAAVRNALAVHVALPPALRERVDRYEADSVQGLLLRLARSGGEKVWVRFGAAEEVEAKSSATELLLEELDRGELGAPAVDDPDLERPEEADEPDGPVDPEGAMLDVRAPNNPVVVPGGDE